jgi:hypothetical protein
MTETLARWKLAEVPSRAAQVNGVSGVIVLAQCLLTSVPEELARLVVWDAAPAL